MMDEGDQGVHVGGLVYELDTYRSSREEGEGEEKEREKEERALEAVLFGGSIYLFMI